jgi:hypothetical protein
MNYNAQINMITDPRPLDPPEYWLDDRDPVEKTLIVSGSHGDRVPQVFCRGREKIDSVAQEDWKICRSGPEREGYWDAWSEVLNSWEYEEYDCNYSLFKVYLEHDTQRTGHLLECKEFIRNDPD